MIVSIAVAACSPRVPLEGEATPAPPDSPGTALTAARLTLGACGVFDEGKGKVTVVLNDDGLCVANSWVSAEECHFYDDIEVDIDGVRIPQVASGGWKFASDFGWGCSYPAFELDPVKELASSGGPQRLTVRIGGEPMTAVAVDWFVERRLRLPAGVIVGGTEALVLIEPGVDVDPADPWYDPTQGFYFTYDERELNRAWCRAKNGWDGYDSSLAEAAPEVPGGTEFLVPIPEGMPVGTGTLGTTDFYQRVKVSDCPFAECRVNITRGAQATGIQAVQP
ncbi:hypothetical protein [Sorangium sp. So ce406]|uniref:hypothetical protein n=1 Tax=Sorangium sp. So ce406 TaxID=3133311 RepID=UPI003F5C66E9